MTRQEAINVLKMASGGLYGSPIIDGLEALGLIKFDQELTAKQIIEKMQTQVSGDCVIAALQRGGYKIIKE